MKIVHFKDLVRFHTFNRAYYNYEEVPNPEAQWFYDILKSIEVHNGIEDMEKPVNASNNKCRKSLSWGPSKRKLESADIRGRSRIIDEDENNEDEEEVKWESDEEEEEIESEYDCEAYNMVCGSKKRAHPVATSTLAASTSVETSTTLVETASFPLRMSLSLAVASTPPGMSLSPAAPSTPRRPSHHFCSYHTRSHTRRGGRRHSRTGYRGVVTRGPRDKMDEAFTQSELYVLLHPQKGQWAKYYERKANVEQLHIETGSPIPTDEQLMFEATGESNKDHVCGFSSQSPATTVELQGGSSSSISSVPLVFSAAGHKAYIERKRRLWGYMQLAQERFFGFMKSFAPQCGVQFDSVLTLFPPFSPLDDDAISQPSTSPSFSSPPLPPPPPVST
ncbi:hypothetical protein M9H77_22336 [Catharanthus roseus]|uniref:Uncharacterized protein n=1 Tax=Catharanthus roseus TaxID=4058 RepID=A0ACC0APW0_CATRO|nr:hypothetical protein M9H77_22336 [Catharanthus roseus]